MAQTREEVAKAFIYQGSRFLLQLRDNRPDIPYPNYWGLFGGLVDAGETPSQTLVRELEEELGWTPSEPQYLLTWEGPDDPCVNHIFLVPLTVAVTQLKLTEGQDLGLFAPEELSQLSLIPIIRHLLPQVVAAIASDDLTASWERSMGN